MNRQPFSHEMFVDDPLNSNRIRFLISSPFFDILPPLGKGTVAAIGMRGFWSTECREDQFTLMKPWIEEAADFGAERDDLVSSSSSSLAPRNVKRRSILSDLNDFQPRQGLSVQVLEEAALAVNREEVTTIIAEVSVDAIANAGLDRPSCCI
ncbi:hypothetical protein C8J56DRAFT_1139514 [Mycena floridula]|nr:hypothetical protein C8J56DRAFT_1139514 [Mycena floridula]